MVLFIHQQSFGQDKPITAQQIQALEQEKGARTPAERKISSQLLQAIRAKSGQSMADSVNLPPPNVGADTVGNLAVDINASVDDSLLTKLKALGATIIFSSVQFHSIRARVNLGMIETIAGYGGVKFIKPAAIARTVGRV